MSRTAWQPKCLLGVSRSAGKRPVTTIGYGFVKLRVSVPTASKPIWERFHKDFLFDRTKPAMELERCRRHVRAVDGDGNSSQWVEAQRVPGEAETYYGFAGYRSQQGGRGGFQSFSTP